VVATASEGPEAPKQAYIGPRTAYVEGLWVPDRSYWSQTLGDQMVQTEFWADFRPTKVPTLVLAP
jgi:hypothetical protein